MTLESHLQMLLHNYPEPVVSDLQEYYQLPKNTDKERKTRDIMKGYLIDKYNLPEGVLNKYG